MTKKSSHETILLKTATRYATELKAIETLFSLDLKNILSKKTWTLTPIMYKSAKSKSQVEGIERKAM